MNKSIKSYKEWCVSGNNLSRDDTTYEAYLGYVNDWYKARFEGKTPEELTVDEYRNFLVTLNIVTTDNEVLAYLDRLDYDNDREVQIAIPFFARTLRDIARSVSIKRDESKGAVEDYSHLNSNFGICNDVYRKLMEYHAIVTNERDDEYLSTINHTTIELEELYDDNEYLDKSPNLKASSYFNMDINHDFYNECAVDCLDWVIESGFNKLYSNNDLINPATSGELPISGYIDYNDGDTIDHFKGNLGVSFMGEPHYIISGDDDKTLESFCGAKYPWANVSNRYFPTIANIPLVDNMYSKYSGGGFMIPSKLGLSTALGKNKYHDPSRFDIDSTKKNFPDPTFYSNGYSYSKEFQDSPISHDSYLNWIDVKQSSGKGKGILFSDGKYQEMCPYQSTSEATGVSHLGINRVGDKTDPWFGVEDNIWENPEAFPPDFRNIYDVDGWYDHLESITGVEDIWAIDIYGNNYGLYKNNDFSKFYDRMMDSTGTLYVRGVGGIKQYSDFFNAHDALILNEFNIDSIRDMNVYNDILVLEDDAGSVLIHHIVYRDGGYVVRDGDMVSTTALLGNQYKSFGKCFDDRSNKLYVGVYNTVPVNGFFEFIIYEYSDSKLIEVYNSANDDSDEIKLLKDEFNFNDIIGVTSLCISEMDDALHLTFIGVNDDGSHIINIPFIISGGIHIDEISVVKPANDIAESTLTECRELLHLITTAIYDNKLTIMLEGIETGNKYLQVVNL
jgi:hypothetical protein